MKIHYSNLATVLLFATGLSLSAQKSVYTFPFENAYKLPPMETLIRVNEISASYQTIGNLYTTEITGLGDETMEQVSSTYISDVKAMDAFRFLQFYMEDQLIAPGNETSGSMEMSIIYFHEKQRFNLGSAVGVLTFGIGTLLGIPFSTAVTDVEVEASFFDDTDQYITTHRGVGRGKKLMTLYSISTRTPNQKALKKALTDLNTKIMADTRLTMSSPAGVVPEP